MNNFTFIKQTTHGERERKKKRERQQLSLDLFHLDNNEKSESNFVNDS